jgi:acyl dehydratase
MTGTGSERPFAAGQVLAPLRRGPFTSSHLVRWCAAQQNWHKIHYDLDFAQNQAGLKERVINGALKQHLLAQFLDEFFAGTASIRRLGYRFAGPDYVDESLELHGQIRSVEHRGKHEFAVLDLGIRNVQQDKRTTVGSAVITCEGFAGPDEPDVADMPSHFALDESVEATRGKVPEAMARLVGTEIERIESAYPLDLSRLRLFADALGGLRPLHYDLQAGRTSIHGTVVAPPLFPIHGLEAPPDTLPLSHSREAMGREAVNELGGSFARRFDLPEGGMVNGGCEVELHSLLRLGETLSATCRLVGASVKKGSQGGQMLLTTFLNTYSTTSGRLLLKSRQVTVYRDFA